ncbi:UNKNOWN [Stylonychia lemnae]|uniref:Uncharacterized protein n=1 Tax=Stylonychia lemnae TaxID=5949 RepID=A0A078AIZ7_STYLE|nr:UNKNOWN [Stylonychia lemnae]|eukprot:CDW81871.1 UNKNOWN [Stylonychia lemnae]
MQSLNTNLASDLDDFTDFLNQTNFFSPKYAITMNNAFDFTSGSYGFDEYYIKNQDHFLDKNDDFPIIAKNLQDLQSANSRPLLINITAGELIQMHQLPVSCSQSPKEEEMPHKDNSLSIDCNNDSIEIQIQIPHTNMTQNQRDCLLRNSQKAHKFSFEKFKRECLVQLGIKRIDVLVKTTLRKIRKYYLKQFLTLTNYNKSKKKQGPQFLIQKVREYLVLTNMQPNINESDLRQKRITQELEILLGSMFYLKIMKQIYTENDELQSIEKIHNSLYLYTDKNLLQLFESESFILLFNHFKSVYNEESNPCLQKIIGDDEQFILGMKFLCKLKSQIDRSLIRSI